MIVSETTEDPGLYLSGWVRCWAAYPCWRRRRVSPYCWSISLTISIDLGISSSGKYILRFLRMCAFNVEDRTFQLNVFVVWFCHPFWTRNSPSVAVAKLNRVLRTSGPAREILRCYWVEECRLLMHTFQHSKCVFTARSHITNALQPLLITVTTVSSQSSYHTPLPFTPLFERVDLLSNVVRRICNNFLLVALEGRPLFISKCGLQFANGQEVILSTHWINLVLCCSKGLYFVSTSVNKISFLLYFI